MEDSSFKELSMPHSLSVRVAIFLSADSFSSALLVRLKDQDGDDGDDFFQKFRKERKN